MCVTKITKRTRGKGIQLLWVYHVFQKRGGKLFALFSHGGKYYEYKTDTIHIADDLHRKRPRVVRTPNGEAYVTNFHSFTSEQQARAYFKDQAYCELLHFELRRVRAYEINAVGEQGPADEPREVIIHRKMYIPKGGQYIVCRN